MQNEAYHRGIYANSRSRKMAGHSRSIGGIWFNRNGDHPLEHIFIFCWYSAVVRSGRDVERSSHHGGAYWRVYIAFRRVSQRRLNLLFLLSFCAISWRLVQIEPHNIWRFKSRARFNYTRQKYQKTPNP